MTRFDKEPSAYLRRKAKSRSTATAAATLVWSVCALIGGARSIALAQPAHARVRAIPQDSDRPLASRLLPDDEVVTIYLSGDHANSGAPVPTSQWTVKQELENDALLSAFVVVMDVQAIAAVLSEHDSWVDTRLTGTVRDVLRVSENHRIARGQHIEARASGGELMIGKVLVKTEGAQRVGQLQTHRSYLLFLVDVRGETSPRHVRRCRKRSAGVCLVV